MPRAHQRMWMRGRRPGTGGGQREGGVRPVQGGGEGLKFFFVLSPAMTNQQILVAMADDSASSTAATAVPVEAMPKLTLDSA
jgi:hypothetical protein